MTRPDLHAASTIGEAWLALRSAFRAAGLDTADLDARLLTSRLADLAPHDLVVRGDAVLSEPLRQALIQAASDRLGGKPAHRILGARDFFGLQLTLSAATLEPRPDTETLVEAVLPFVQARETAAGKCRILDLGAGTGAIGLALLAQCPRAECIGVDISEEAVETARANAQAHDLASRYRAITGNWFAGIEGRFDLIVSNPPYIRSGDLASLSPEVVGHDPVRALDGGDDGLDAYRILCGQAPAWIEPDGLVAFEIGQGQGPDVTELARDAGLEPAGAYHDLGGVERVLAFVLPGTSNAPIRDI